MIFKTEMIDLFMAMTVICFENMTNYVANCSTMSVLIPASASGGTGPV